jgi:hypothetical protein
VGGGGGGEDTLAGRREGWGRVSDPQ